MTSPPRSSPLALTVLCLLIYRPLHPYGIQRLIKQWGKDQVVNVSQRASLYRTIERLHSAGLIAVRETGRDQLYPERTVYELTAAGRETAHAWMLEMLSTPRQEYPEFPAALSYLMLLAPEEIAEALGRRADALERSLASAEAAQQMHRQSGLPRITSLEDEYLHAVASAELRWIRSVLTDLREGRLDWSPEQLLAYAAGVEAEEGPG
ncbi:PadR family transcriptional regulator [Peterkaempfera sp. SMS 1(5)a]|uniref:PadR family transcriptional regulator n=1 Tax=Peterkaempfera podocarpi TaxID=3232308 RepID=UPI00366BE6A0